MTEYTVHDECDTNHVAAVFKNGQEQEQDRHLRDEAEHGSQTADDTVHHKVGNNRTSADIPEESADRVLDRNDKYIIGPVRYPGADCRDRHIIYRPHDHDKDRDAEDTVG